MAHSMLTRSSMLFSCAFLVALASPASAANFTFSGSLMADDDVEVFAFTIATPRIVTMETVSFSGGLDVNGQPVAAGGFDSLLTLFTQGGLIFDQNDDGPSPSDSQLVANLGAGTYFLALSQFDNFPVGPFLFDGFTRSGQGNFTGPACGVQDGSFYALSNCEQRSSAYTVNLIDVDSAVVVPEPSTLWLILAGISGALLYRVRVSAQARS